MDNLKKVSIAMSVNEVVEIMGKPIDTVDYFKEPVIEAYYYEAPFLNSDGIYIGFDDKGKVNFIKSDKGEIKTKKEP